MKSWYDQVNKMDVEVLIENIKYFIERLEIQAETEELSQNEMYNLNDMISSLSALIKKYKFQKGRDQYQYI